MLFNPWPPKICTICCSVRRVGSETRGPVSHRSMYRRVQACLTRELPAAKRRRTRALSRRPGEATGPKGILRHDHWPNAAVCTSRYVVATFRLLSSIDTRDTAIQRVQPTENALVRRPRWGFYWLEAVPGTWSSALVPGPGDGCRMT